MARSFGVVEYKVKEAEFFLRQVRYHGKKADFWAVQYCTSAFVSAARSITFAMQASLKGLPEFDSWYLARQEILRKNALARFFHDFRTVTQHIGENLVSRGTFSNGIACYHFLPCADLAIVPEMDVISACEGYFKTVLELVFDCYVDLRTTVDGQWYFTAENFERLGKTVEDAEEELGLARGWTDIKRPGFEPQRWKVLRQTADGCNIQVQFREWLGKSLERPAEPPPFQF